MSKTLHQFGRVLFDELEQIAVRRGGFASLKWVEHELGEALRGVEVLRKKAAEPFIDPGSELRLLSSVKGLSDIPKDLSDIAKTGKGLILVAEVRNVLHFRMFDGDGNVVVDTHERELAEEEEQIEKLRKQLSSLWPPHELNAFEKDQVITAATSLVDHTIPSLRKTADRCARRARKALALATRTEEAVAGLGEIIGDTVKTAQEVLNKLRAPDRAPECPPAAKSLASRVREVFDRFRRPEHHKPWEERVHEVELELAQHATNLRAARQTLGVQPVPNHQEQLADEADRFEHICRVAWGLKEVEGLEQDDPRVPREALEVSDDEAGGSFDKHGAYERLIRGAVVLRSRRLASALKHAADEFHKVFKAYQTMADVKKKGPVAELGRMVAEQPAASRYEIYDVVEDAARNRAMRMGTVGLVFSGGGIRSATFNLGFLQGAAALGLLKQFDYLSTVSGGGYIGAWFAAWVLREGGGAGDPELPTELDFVRDLAARSAAAEKKINDEVRRPPHAVGDQQAPDAAPQEKREAAKALLQNLCELRLLSSVKGLSEIPKDLSDILKRGKGLILVAEVRNVLHFRMFDGDGKLVVDIDAGRLTGQKEQVKKLKQQLGSVWPRQEPCAIEKCQVISAVTSIVNQVLQDRYEDEVTVKRQRTSLALENVQKQLSSSRARQAKAVRGWVSPAALGDGREATGHPPPLKRTVEEEPEPVHHLREYSNYLAPKIGLLSADNWTMVSVYLRNLFLNQFVLLPTMLFVISLPRLLLLLFTHSTSDPMMTLARGWLARYDGWPEPAVLLLAIAAIVAAPKLVHSFAWRKVARLHELTILALVVLGIAAVAIDFMTPILPRPNLPNIPGAIPPLVRWLALNPWATGLIVLVPLAVAAAIRYKRVAQPTLNLAQKPYGQLWAWDILCALVLGTAVLASWLPPLVLYLAEPFFWPFTGDGALFLVTVVMAWLGFHWTYQTVAQIPKSSRLASAIPADHPLAKRTRWWTTLGHLVFFWLAFRLLLALPLNASDRFLFEVTVVMAWVAVHWMRKAFAETRDSRRLASAVAADGRARSDVAEPFRWWRTVIALTFVSCGVSLLFARPEKPFFVFSLPMLSSLFHPATANWGGMKFWPAVACFGALVGLMRGLSSFIVNMTDRSRQWTPIDRLLRAYSACWSGLISGTGLAAALSWLRALGDAQPGGPGAVMMSFGPALVMVAIGAGSALEVGFIAGYSEENLREWRASLGAYLLMFGALWTALCVLSIYGPFCLWRAGSWSHWAAGAAWVVILFFGALAGRSQKPYGVKASKSPLVYVAAIAPLVFLVGLVVAAGVLVAAIQDVSIAARGDLARDHFLYKLSIADPEWTWIVVLASACLAMVACVRLNINLFGLNAFYSNRLVRCYLGASRPRGAPNEERPNFAPTNSAGPVRRPNPITRFDGNDDFPIGDLAIFRFSCGSDLVLMPSVKDVNEIQKMGRDLIIVAAVGNVLHFRVFDSDGEMALDTDENGLTEQAGQIETLRKQLACLQPNHINSLRLPPDERTERQTCRVITALTSIVNNICGSDDLVVNYRGPYHLINTAMNLVAGSELAWQERMAESFILSPLYCGSKSTGYRRSRIVKSDLEPSEIGPWEVEDMKDSDTVHGYGGDIRLGTAISVSGAAASPNAGYHSSPLVTFMMTMLNARLGLWFGHPAQAKWRRSGPAFAVYLLGELFGLTTNRGKYVNLSDGGHFENLGAYELVRRRCRYIIVCDAGADPGLSFWDLGSLVRKCRQDFGIRIEIDTSPLLKKEGTPYAKWHCAVGQIHYDDVDVEALPGVLLYIKPSLSGDEPSDVRNYVVEHPSFPHESTANQFFSESQFESYRELGEHIARKVFSDAASDAGPDSSAATLFSRLRLRWTQAPPSLDKDYLESVKPCLEIHEALRTDSKLEGLSRELYPNGGQPTSDGARPARASPAGDDRAQVHAVIEMVQAMENAWIALNLDAYSDHPFNRGWMNAFRRWISSEIFRTHWPMVRGEFSEGFVRFCESELNLTVPDPEFAWLELKGASYKYARTTISFSVFNEGLRDLDKEFSLEWPRIFLDEIGDGRSGLAEMFRHARQHPPMAGERPLAALIRPGESAGADRPTSEPSYYGVILAWGSSDGVVELVVWLRGAYRTLGLGRAVKKTLNVVKEELKEMALIENKGYTLRTRYPSDDRTGAKQMWQRTLWSDFFQNQGFYRDETDSAVNAPNTLIFRWPR